MIAPAVLGADVTNIADVHRRMDAALMGHGYAKSALDVACWDAFGRIVVNRLLPCSVASFSRSSRFTWRSPSGPPAEMAQFAQRERAAGIHRFQLKLGAAPQDDAARVLAVVAATGSTDEITGDANGAWHRQDALLFANL